MVREKALLYGYSVGASSSRRIEKKLYEDVAFRVLGAGNYLDHDTITEFRRRHLEALLRLFVQVLKSCSEAGLVKSGHIAIDGTKVKANASKHKVMSYGRVEGVKENTGERLKEVSADAGYYSEENVKYVEAKKSRHT